MRLCPMIMTNDDEGQCWSNAGARSNGHNRYPAQTKG